MHIGIYENIYIVTVLYIHKYYIYTYEHIQYFIYTKYYIYTLYIIYIYIYTYIWASLVAQLVKNLPAMQETPVQFLGWEDPLEKG